MKIRVRKSRLTGHWVVNPGQSNAQGFRRWADAMAAADRRATKRMGLVEALTDLARRTL
jgi:hypothetical protein